MIPVSDRPIRTSTVNPLFDALIKGQSQSLINLQDNGQKIHFRFPDFFKNAVSLFECLFKPELSHHAIGVSITFFRRLIWTAIEEKPAWLEPELLGQLKPILDKALVIHEKNHYLHMQYFMVQSFFEGRSKTPFDFAGCFYRIEKQASNMQWITQVVEKHHVDELCEEITRIMLIKFPFSEKQSLEAPSQPPAKRQKSQDPLTPYLIAVHTNPQVAKNWMWLGAKLPKGGSVTLHNDKVMSQLGVFLEAYKLDPKNSSHIINLGFALEDGTKIKLLNGEELTNKELFYYATQMDKNNPEGYFHLAMTLKPDERFLFDEVKLGGKELLEKALKIKPDFEKARIALDEMG